MIRCRLTIAVSLAGVMSVLSLGMARAEPPAADVKSTAASCARPNFRVVLDVGHTSRSPGAKSARGADEFDFNLKLARQIDDALLKAGFAKTVRVWVSSLEPVGDSTPLEKLPDGLTLPATDRFHYDPQKRWLVFTGVMGPEIHASNGSPSPHHRPRWARNAPVRNSVVR